MNTLANQSYIAGYQAGYAWCQSSGGHPGTPPPQVPAGLIPASFAAGLRQGWGDCVNKRPNKYGPQIQPQTAFTPGGSVVQRPTAVAMTPRTVGGPMGLGMPFSDPRTAGAPMVDLRSAQPQTVQAPSKRGVAGIHHYGGPRSIW